MASLLPEGKQYFAGDDGLPLVGGRLYTYDAGTVTPRVTYQDAAGTIPNTNPIILDARGEAVIFWSGAYKVKLATALDVAIWTVDNVLELVSPYQTSSTGSVIVPVGTTAQRDVPPLTGYFRYNITINSFEGYNGSNWLPFLMGPGLTGAVSLNGGQFAGTRNKIINGKMEITQRGNSFSFGPGTSGFGADRWAVSNGTSGTVGSSLLSTVPPSGEFLQSLGLTPTIADVGIAAGEYFQVYQRIEGFNIKDLIGRTFTVSFWVRSSKTGIHCMALNNDGDRSLIKEYTVNVANVWEYKSIPILNGLITAGTWNYTNGRGLTLAFALAAGTTYQTTPDTWNVGGFIATASQVNCLDNIANTFCLTGVQLEVGTVATPFEHRLYGLELAMCQRYYYRQTPGAGTEQFAAGVCLSANVGQFFVAFPTVMRAAPSFAQSGTPGDYSVYWGGGPTVCNVVPTLYAASPWGAGFRYGTAVAMTANAGAFAAAVNANAYIAWSAEL